MGFLTKKKGIVWVRPWGYEWLTKFVFPQGTVIGQEVVDKENLEKAVVDWVNRELKGRLDEAEIVVADTVVFSKDIPEITKIDEFWLEVPIDPTRLAKLIVKAERNWKAFASNSEIYGILERALITHKISVIRVIPEAIKHLPKLDFRQPILNEVDSEQSGKKINLRASILVLGLIMALGILGVVVWKSGVTGQTKPKVVESKITPTQTLIPTPTESVKEEVAAVDKKSFKIKILNGSGVAGKAGEVKDFLVGLGYGEILTGNADRSDYSENLVKIKSTGQAIWVTLGADLRSKYEMASAEAVLSADSEVDVEIILGGK